MKLRKVKALIIIAFLLILCCTLTACDPGNYKFTSEDLADVVSIELINYDNPNQKHFRSWVPDHTSDLKPINNDKMNCLEILDESKINDFVNNLCECYIFYKYFAYDSPNGNCIKLNYSNGDFLIIWSNYKANRWSGYIGIYSPEGKVIEFIGCFESLEYYKDLVNNFFQTQI